uniref:POU domain protein n=1 Tax=Meloidogyne hapla TaxID=6305 RepID=A0A1I8BGA3_MELHA
ANKLLYKQKSAPLSSPQPTPPPSSFFPFSPSENYFHHSLCMINTDFQQLGSPSSANNSGNGTSAAALLAAALNVVNSTSASNSPPELLSMATTNSSSTVAQLCNPFSPAAAAAFQLAALYNSSIPSPGGSAFARCLHQQVAAAQQPQPSNSAISTVAAFAAANSPANSSSSSAVPQFGPGSPFAQLDHLALLRNSSLGLSCPNGSTEIPQLHQLQLQQSAPTNTASSSYTELAECFQRQAAAFSNAAQVVQLIAAGQQQQQQLIPSLPFSPSQQQQLTAAAMALAKQQQQSVQLNSPASILFQEQQAQQQIQEAQAPLPPLSTSVEQTLTNPSTDASTSFVGGTTLEQLTAIAAAASNVLQASNNGECSTNTSIFNPIGMDTSNCVASSSSSVGSQNQQQEETQINMSSIDTSATNEQQQSQHIRRIRRRRPKEEIAGKTLHRRNTTLCGENSSCVSVIEQMVDSPCSLGPFSVQQPLTPANDLCNSILLKTVGDNLFKFLKHKKLKKNVTFFKILILRPSCRFPHFYRNIIFISLGY